MGTHFTFFTIPRTKEFLTFRSHITLLQTSASRAGHALETLFSYIKDAHFRTYETGRLMSAKDLEDDDDIKRLLHDHFDDPEFVVKAGLFLMEASRLPRSRRESLRDHFERTFSSLYDKGCECRICKRDDGEGDKGDNEKLTYTRVNMDEYHCKFVDSTFEDFQLASSVEGITSESSLMDMDPTLFDVFLIREQEKQKALNRQHQAAKKQRERVEQGKKSSNILQKRFGPKASRRGSRRR